MAQRRMFSKTITNSSRFLMMPPTSQLLYVHLSMNADDDGFCEHFPIMRMVEAKPDDLKVLSAKGFVNIFDDKVLIISEWKENNYIQKDRYSPSKYLDVYKKELKLLAKNPNSMYTERIQDVSNLDTQVRLGKVRVGEDIQAETSSADIVSILDVFSILNPACKKMYGNTTQRKACQHLIDTYGMERVIKIVSETLPKTNGLQFFPTITTPVQLQDKYTTLESAIKKYQAEKLTNKNKYQII